jgi:hypothetical protein
MTKESTFPSLSSEYDYWHEKFSATYLSIQLVINLVSKVTIAFGFQEFPGYLTALYLQHVLFNVE